MSVHHIRRCARLQMPATPKVVLMALADAAKEDHACWPSIRALSAWTCLSERSIQNALQWLAEHGVITIEKRFSQDASSGAVAQRSNLYILHPDQFDGEEVAIEPSAAEAPEGGAPDAPGGAVRAGEGGAPAAGGGAPDAPGGVQELHPNHKREPKDKDAHKARTPRRTSLPDGFAVSDRVRQWAGEHQHGQLDEHLAYFVGYVRANGKTYVDWDQAFMNAIRGNWAKVAPAAAPAARSGIFAGAK